jgi:hypothetical protein
LTTAVRSASPAVATGGSGGKTTPPHGVTCDDLRAPVKARTPDRRPENVVPDFKHRITNAASESTSFEAQWVQYTAGGFRNKANAIAAICFHCPGLDLMPSTH